jgi:hypothetical protein
MFSLTMLTATKSTVILGFGSCGTDVDTDYLNNRRRSGPYRRAEGGMAYVFSHALVPGPDLCYLSVRNEILKTCAY